MAIQTYRKCRFSSLKRMSHAPGSLRRGKLCALGNFFPGFGLQILFLPFLAVTDIMMEEQGQKIGKGRSQNLRSKMMSEQLESLAQASILFAVIFVLTAIGFALARRYRDRDAKDISESSTLMSKFRELHSEGGLSDEEFRTIKTKLASELKAELNNNNDNR